MAELLALLTLEILRASRMRRVGRSPESAPVEWDTDKLEVINALLPSAEVIKGRSIELMSS
jgi:hypothetical protein